MTAILDYTSKTKITRNNLLVFAIYWTVLFIIYLPAANAGRVGDFPGWVNFLTTNSFLDYVNRTYSGIAGMYQFTQIVSYGFYKIFGANAWCWHLLYITLQALNALLLYLFFRQLFITARLKDSAMVAFSGALLFCLTPYISEVVVWESSFHYLLGFLLMLLVLLCTQNYVITQKIKFAWWAALIFFLSSYSLEIFYLTPLFVITLAVFYRFALGLGKGIFKELFLYFTLPQVVIFIIHLLLLHIIYHSGVAHIGTAAVQVNGINLAKSLKYIFHIVFFGRFFSGDFRTKVYAFCDSLKGLWIFYGIATVVLLLIVFRLRQMNIAGKTIVLLLLWVAMSLGLLLPLWFPDTGLVIYDRYTYVLDAFLFMFLALLINSLFNRYLFLFTVGIYALINIRFTHKVNAYWQQSAHIVNNLVSTFPNDPSKKVLLLNLPECLDGVQMIGTRDDGEFRMMYNSIRGGKIGNPVYDVEAFYMRSPTDGAHVNFVNDTTVKVTLNQWGTWWVYYGYGATSYENADYKLIMRDQGHWYDLILKHPANEYLLLYVVGDQWKKVDLDRKNVDQY